MIVKTIGASDQGTTRVDVSRVKVWDKECETDIVPQGGYAPRIFVSLLASVLEQHIHPTVCTVTVEGKDGKTAVVHLEVRVRDGKVTGIMTAGSLHRDVTKTVNVPVWNRKYVGRHDNPHYNKKGGAQ